MRQLLLRWKIIYLKMETKDDCIKDIEIMDFNIDDIGAGKSNMVYNSVTDESINTHKESSNSEITVNKLENKSEEVSCYREQENNKEMYREHINGTFKCNICQKVLCEHQLMLEHLETHKKNSHKCKICGRGYHRSGDLSRHMNREHTKKANKTVNHEEETFVCEMCEVCGKTFVSHKSFIVHKRIHSYYQYECKLCKKRFLNKSNLEDHWKTHTGEKSYICDICGKGSSTAHRLKMHKIIHSDEKPFECKVCHQRYKYASSMRKHWDAHNGVGKSYICDECGVVFANKNILEAHLSVHSGEKPFQCSLCEKKFRLKRLLNRHVKVKHKEKDSSLENVSQNQNVKMKEIWVEKSTGKFVHEKSRSAHVQNNSKLDQINLKPVRKAKKCTQQDHSFEKAPDKLNEISNATKDNNKFCNKNKAFNCSKSVLTNNIMIPIPNDDVECIHKSQIEKKSEGEIPERKFHTNSIHQRLVKLHSGEKLYECYKCHQKFERDFMLKLHMHQHTGEWPYKCKICHSSFRHSRFLDIHILRHTEEKALKCEIKENSSHTSNVNDYMDEIKIENHDPLEDVDGTTDQDIH